MGLPPHEQYPAVMHALLESKRKGRGEEGYNEDEDMTGEANEEEPDGAGWTTDEDEEDWAKRFLEGHEEEAPGDASDDEDEWPDNDDIVLFFFVRLLFDGVHKTYILILRTYAQYI